MANETQKVTKSKAEWQQQLSPMEYSVTRERGIGYCINSASLKFEPQQIVKK